MKACSRPRPRPEKALLPGFVGHRPRSGRRGHGKESEPVVLALLHRPHGDGGRPLSRTRAPHGFRHRLPAVSFLLSSRSRLRQHSRSGKDRCPGAFRDCRPRGSRRGLARRPLPKSVRDSGSRASALRISNLLARERSSQGSRTFRFRSLARGGPRHGVRSWFSPFTRAGKSFASRSRCISRPPTSFLS